MKRAILLIAVALFCIGQSFGPKIVKGPMGSYSPQLHLNIDLTNGCVAFWDMNEAGNVNREDATAYNRDLTDEHGNVNGAAGVINNAAYYQALETQKLLSTDSVFGGAGSFSIAVWARSEVLEDELNPLVTRYDVTGWGVWATFFYEGRLKTIFAQPGGTWHSLTNYATGTYTNTWIFYAFGYDSSTSKGWISTNGVAIGETAALTGGLTNVASSTIPLTVGNWTGLDNCWYGRIDEMGYWDRRLNQNEITALYNGGAGLTYTNFNSKYSPP